MTKNEFLDALGKGLAQLPPEERERHLSYYAEMLDDRVEDGQSEEEAVASLGAVGALVEQIYQETPLPVLVKSRVRPRRGWTPAAVVLAVIGSPVWVPMAACLVCVLLSVYVVIWSLIAALFAVVAALAAAGVACLIVPFFLAGPTAGLVVLSCGSGLVCLGAAVLAFVGSAAGAKGLVRLTGLFARWVKSLFIRKEAAQ